tara:strand:- start:340 stop:537 length:198 start_codon:yes stop_codon:yes gene_type:complete
MTEPLPLLVDTGEACRLIFGSRARKNYYRLYEMIEREEIAGTKIGGRWFIPGKAMQKFIDDIADD